MILTGLLALVGTIPQITATEIPPYTGKYNVGVTKQIIAVKAYPDILAPGNISSSFLATIFYPTLQSPDIPGATRYLTQGTATIYEEDLEFPNGTLGNLTDRVIWEAPFAETLEEDEGHPSPTLIFGSGLGGPPCECYTIMLSELASRGYTVAALDHPYEQPYVLYPNGSEFYGGPIDVDTQGAAAVYNRSNDTLAFIGAWPALSGELGFASTTDHLGIFGHSIGGSVALEVAQLVDPSLIVSGINMDGEFWLALNSSAADIRRPSLLLASENHNGAQDPSWITYPEQQSDWWRFITIDGAEHLDYSDFTFWKDFNPGSPAPTGNISTARMIEITNTFIGGFFNWTLLGQDEAGIFNNPAQIFPETVLSGGSDGRDA